MVVATGTGEMRKEFASAGSFTYPVGDNTGTADYSPVTLTFNSGTFAGSNYAGVSLVNAKYPDPNITVDYLDRYWTVTSANITNFNCNASFEYKELSSPNGDLHGTESLLYCVKAAPVFSTYNQVYTATLPHYISATGLTNFGTYTGAKQVWQGNLSVFLEGPYNTGTNTMGTLLNTNNLIAVDQPYTYSPINYTGNETHAIPMPADVVDWVYVELRHAATPGAAGPTTWFAKAAAFLKSDGTLVDFSDGVSPVKFYNTQGTPGTDNIYPVIRHRNHIGIIADGNGLGTGTGATKNADGTYTFDFRTGIGQALGTINGYKQINTSPVEYGMVSGDGDADGSIFATDYNLWSSEFGLLNNYYASDFNFDGNVFSTDYNVWSVNFGTNNPVLGSNKVKATYSSQVPEKN
jgi:hypothetical protein